MDKIFPPYLHFSFCIRKVVSLSRLTPCAFIRLTPHDLRLTVFGMLRTFIFITSYFLLAISLESCSGGGGGDGGGGVGTAPAPQYSISGGVTSGGSGLEGTTMTLTGAGSASTITDSNGAFQLTGLNSGSYTITPSKAGYTFNPINSAVTVSNANIAGQDFVATLMTWAKAYGGGNKDVAHSIQQTSDGGFIVAGETSSFGAGNSDVWVLKLNGDGNTDWQKVYGGIYDDIAHSIQQTSDDGYILAGETSSFGVGINDTDIWILKLDKDGIMQWGNRYGGGGNWRAYSIQQTSDRGYIVAGETNYFESNSDALVFKLKENGEIDWLRTYGASNADVANSVQKTEDGGFIVAGETRSFGAGGADIWVLKLKDNGDVAWQETFGGNKDDTAYSAQQTSDGKYFIIAGGATPAGSIFNDVFLLKLDTNGTVVWDFTYGGSNNDVAFSVQQTSDGGFVIAGKTSPDPINSDMWVLKLDSDGGVVWQQTYGGQGSHSANFVRQNLDGGYIVAGETSLGAGDADVWVLKLDGNGNIGGGCPVVGISNVAGVSAGFNGAKTLVAPNDATVVPNPTSTSSLDSNVTPTIQCSFP